MATTSPDNLWTPDSGDDYALTVDLAATADTVQTALNSRLKASIQTSGQLVGVTPPGNTNFIFQTGVTGGLSTNSNGDTSIVYPQVFPNGVLSAKITRYDYTGIYGATFEILATAQGLNQLNFRIYNSAGNPVASISGIRYSYEVIGW